MVMEEEMRLLILEPEEQLRAVLEEQFAEQGFSVTTVTSGDAALSLLESPHETFAGFITETTFSGTPGNILELLGSFTKGSPPRLPVVIITTGDQKFEVDEAFRSFVDAVFYKPYERITLEELLKSAILPRVHADCNRQYTRVEAHLPVKFTIPETGQTFDGMSHNVAQGGISVIAPGGQNPAIGSRLAFMMFPPRSAPIPGVGQVVWRRNLGPGLGKLGFGLRFLPEESDMKRLSKLINELKTVRNIED